MWKSRISWRITLTVFATLLLVQTVVLIFTSRSYEAEHLARLREQAHTALVFSLGDTRNQLASPFTKPAVEKLFGSAAVEGFAVYGLDDSLIEIYGIPPLLRPSLNGNAPPSRRSADNRHYEILFTPEEIGHPYNIAMRMNASMVEPHVVRHIHQTLWILLFMSGFVTSVLMMVLSLWLLEPMILLRNNLLSAVHNPERPDIKNPVKITSDEIGTTLRIANDLIRQNARNMKHLQIESLSKIRKAAYFDSLTGLPNQAHFLEKLEEVIKLKVLGEGDVLAVMAVDVDHFKHINDSMGHEVGDQLLEAVAKRLNDTLPDDAILSRSSADEFGIMVLLTRDQPDSSVLTEKIFSAMNEPVKIQQESFQVRVSIGVAHYPADGGEARQILKNVDIALNRAKEDGRNTVRYYSADFDRVMRHRFHLLHDLNNALSQNQLQLHYHPQFDLKTGELTGAEALLRWWRPDDSKAGGAFVPPIEFIPVAEQSGLIVSIGEFVLKTACRTNKMWQEKGLPPFRMAVNMSGVQLHRGKIIEQITDILKETRLDARWLELEVTESVFMDNTQVTIDIINHLRAQGIELAMDDFGTGYSSLSYLRHFPISRLKIDQSFIRDALVNPDDRMIVKTIISLGHSLGMKVIAEGVETQGHEDFLKEEGCDESQGFKYTKPIPADKFWDFAVAHNRTIGIRPIAGSALFESEKEAAKTYNTKI